MDKVFLVKIDQITYENWFIERICSTREKADLVKLEVENKISNIKEEYFKKYGIKYDDELKLLNDNDYIFSDEYETTIERVFEFKFRNPELDYNEITISEEEVY